MLLNMQVGTQLIYKSRKKQSLIIIFGKRIPNFAYIITKLLLLQKMVKGSVQMLKSTSCKYREN